VFGSVSSTDDDTGSNGYMIATLILIGVIVIIIIAVLYRYRQGSVEVMNMEWRLRYNYLSGVINDLPYFNCRKSKQCWWGNTLISTIPIYVSYHFHYK
jgi:hypothetical protein